MTVSNTVAAYEQLVRALRGLMAAATASSTVPMAFLADLDQAITATEVAVSIGTLPFVPREAVKELARWMWDRGFGSQEMADFDLEHRGKLIRGAGIANVPGTWEAACTLVAKVEARIDQQPGLPAPARHHGDEHEQWLPETATPAADPFRNGPRAEANRRAKAKAVARWLWDRNIDGERLLGYTPKYRREIARAAGVNPPSAIETWEVAAGLMTKMKARAAAEPNDPATVRHHLDEHEQWATDPHAAKAA